MMTLMAAYGPSWRTVGPWADGTEFAAINPLDPTGSYQIYLRAIGEGGYSIERMGSLAVAYPSESGSSFESSLDSSDDTPPTTPIVDDSLEFCMFTDRLTGYWRSTDPQSGIEQYQYRIVKLTETGSTSGGKSGGGKGATAPAPSVSATATTTPYVAVTEWASAAGMEIFTIRGLDLEHNRRHFIEVKARNGAGLWSGIGRSDGVLIDTTGASAPEISNIITGEFAESMTAMAEFTPPSEEDASVPYGVSYTTAAGKHIPMSGTTTSGTAGPAMSETMAAKVSASTGVSSTGAMLGSSWREILDEPTGPFANSVSARWREAVDEESGVVGYYYALETSAGNTDLVGWTFTYNKQVIMQNLPVSQGQQVFFMVRALNGAGKLGQVAAEILTIDYEDDTPPRRAPHVIASYDADSDSLTVYWYGDGGDPESGLVEYQWVLQRGSGEGAELDWTSIGMSRRVETEVELDMGITYYVKVKAINGAGLFTVGTSEGITRGVEVMEEMRQIRQP